MKKKTKIILHSLFDVRTKQNKKNNNDIHSFIVRTNKRILDTFKFEWKKILIRSKIEQIMNEKKPHRKNQFKKLFWIPFFKKFCSIKSSSSLIMMTILCQSIMMFGWLFWIDIFRFDLWSSMNNDDGWI